MMHTKRRLRNRKERQYDRTDAQGTTRVPTKISNRTRGADAGAGKKSRVTRGFMAASAATTTKTADFHGAKLKGKARFDHSEFDGKTHVSGEFNGETNFNYVLFEGKEKIIFGIVNLSNVSFLNTDITGVRFSDKAGWGEKKVEYGKFWGGKKVKEDEFKIVDERRLEEEINKEKGGHTTKKFNLGSIKAVYRKLRELLIQNEI
jgi:hypothetical protein